MNSFRFQQLENIQRRSLAPIRYAATASKQNIWISDISLLTKTKHGFRLS
jgi:hypothetical protein